MNIYNKTNNVKAKSAGGSLFFGINDLNETQLKNLSEGTLPYKINDLGPAVGPVLDDILKIYQQGKDYFHRDDQELRDAREKVNLVEVNKRYNMNMEIYFGKKDMEMLMRLDRQAIINFVSSNIFKKYAEADTFPAKIKIREIAKPLFDSLEHYVELVNKMILRLAILDLTGLQGPDDVRLLYNLCMGFLTLDLTNASELGMQETPVTFFTQGFENMSKVDHDIKSRFVAFDKRKAYLSVQFPNLFRKRGGKDPFEIGRFLETVFRTMFNVTNIPYFEGMFIYKRNSENLSAEQSFPQQEKK